jgi:hypothetical protein
MVEKTAEMVADIAGLVTGVGPAAKVAEKVADIAEKVKDVAEVASKVNDLVALILKNNGTLSVDDATTQAENEIAGAMIYVESNGLSSDLLLNTTWDILAEVDPTGILGAAKAFYYPLCSKVTA